MHCELCASRHTENLPCSAPGCTRAEPSAPTPRPAAPCATLDLLGRTLGNYRLTRRLGSGGMGVVYLAEHPLIGARVALKVLHPHLAQDEHLRARFYAEARTVNLIGHPNIVRIFDICEEPGGIHYFVMEYLEGTPLSRLPRPMEPGLLIHLLSQACDALDAAHRRGVVHRDLKPENLLMVEQPGALPGLKVLDFGVAKADRSVSDPEQTEAGLILGTPAYMAPEQWAGQEVDGRADIYSLGVTGYLLATGRLPFARGQAAELLLAPEPRLAAPQPPHELSPYVPEALSQVLLRTLARSPAERFATARELHDALLAAGESLDDSQPHERGRRMPAHTPIPFEPPRPDPGDPTPPPAWVAWVRRRSGDGAVVVRCTELSRGGVFMRCAEPFPKLFTRIEFTLLIGGEAVECTGEVVRHVDAAQARAWKMSPGIALQFVEPSPLLREHLRQLRPPRARVPAAPVDPVLTVLP